MNRTAGAAVGLLADRLVGEPPAALHPVAAFGRIMDALEPAMWRDTRAAGAAYALVGVTLAASLGHALRSTVVATAVTVAGRSLHEEALAIAIALERDDLTSARDRLPALVGRDVDTLDTKGVARAVVESVAENTVDAVVAPACWAALAGARGAFAFRAVNTLDAMVGHRTTRYARFGWAAALTDDVAAWVPARLTAALVAAVRPGAARAVVAAVRRDAPAHPSPNAGVAEAAFAAALGVRLGGPLAYRGRRELRPSLGTGPAADVADIRRAVILSRDVTYALAAAFALPSLARTSIRRRRP